MLLQSYTLIDGRRLGYAEYGKHDGVPIFYFHGTPGSRLEAGFFHDTALANQYRLIGIDRPGMGLSSINKRGTLLSWASDVANLADYLGIKKFSILGHSGGGPFVAACAYKIPDRLNGAAIVSGLAPLQNPDSRKGMTLGLKVINFLFRAHPFFGAMIMSCSSRMLKNPRLMSRMIKSMPQVDQAVFDDPYALNAFTNSINETFRNGVTGPSYEVNLLTKYWGFKIENIKYPITIWQGTLDKQVPISHANIYANSIANAELKIIKNEGHISILKNHIEEILRSVCT